METCVVLTSPGDYAKITQEKALLYVTNLTGWNDDITGIGEIKKQFRWGTSNRVRSSWVDLTEKNLLNVILNPNDDLFVDFRITLIAGGPITVNNIEIEYTQNNISKDPYIGFEPVYTVSEKGNIASITKIESFTFKPYQVSPLVVLYKNISNTINQLFGIDVMYARTVPLSIGKDIVLSEWTLYDVDDPKCIKVVVPNNEFPDSKLSFNPMGIDFEMPFEVHITKEYFEQFFGVGVAPQKRDIIYMPIENRLYEVDSTYLYKDLMRTEIYWKVSLVKYQPKSNRKEPQSLREEIDVITTGFQEEFQEELDNLEIKTTDPQQFDPKIGSRNYDPIRESINDKLIISQEKLQNYSLLISETQYDLRSVFNESNNNIVAVTYRAKVDLPPTEERSFSCWFKELKPKISIPKDNIKGGLILGSVIDDMQRITFKLSSVRKFTKNDQIKITKFTGFSLYGYWEKTDAVSGGYNYTILVRKDIIEFLNTYYPNWAGVTGSGYIAEKTYENVLFNGYDIENSKGIRISIHASRYITVKRNNIESLFILKNNLIPEYWYAIFLNLSNFYRQLTLDVWVRKWNETVVNPAQTTSLENIYNNVLTIEQEDLTINSKYNLIPSNVIITNIRFYDKIETDQNNQVTLLNQTIVQDSQFSIIIDNAVQRLTLPWIAKTK